MAPSQLIGKVQMECPLCDTRHEVEERRRIATTVIKDEEVSYEERFYLCPNVDEEENEFESGAMLDENLLNARNAYRRKQDIFASDKVIHIHDLAGCSLHGEYAHTV